MVIIILIKCYFNFMSPVLEGGAGLKRFVVAFSCGYPKSKEIKILGISTGLPFQDVSEISVFVFYLTKLFGFTFTCNLAARYISITIGNLTKKEISFSFL